MKWSILLFAERTRPLGPDLRCALWVFLSDDTLIEGKVLDKEEEEIISEEKIENVILYYDKLDNSEK